MPLLVRIPGWAPAESLRLVVDGQTAPVEWVGHAILISKTSRPTHIQIDYDLPVTRIDEVTDGVSYHFTWRGDEILSMTPNTDWLPFYPTT